MDFAAGGRNPRSTPAGYMCAQKIFRSDSARDLAKPLWLGWCPAHDALAAAPAMAMHLCLPPVAQFFFRFRRLDDQKRAAQRHRSSSRPPLVHALR